MASPPARRTNDKCCKEHSGSVCKFDTDCCDNANGGNQFCKLVGDVKKCCVDDTDNACKEGDTCCTEGAVCSDMCAPSATFRMCLQR